MKISRNITLILMCLASLIKINNCIGQTIHERLVGTWKADLGSTIAAMNNIKEANYNKLSATIQAHIGQFHNERRLIFKADGTYQITFPPEGNRQGNYQISNDAITLTDDENMRIKIYDIITASEQSLILKLQDQENSTIFEELHLVPANE